MSFYQNKVFPPVLLSFQKVRPKEARAQGFQEVGHHGDSTPGKHVVKDPRISTGTPQGCYGFGSSKHKASIMIK